MRNAAWVLLAAGALAGCTTSEATRRVDPASLGPQELAAANQVRVLAEGADYKQSLGPVSGFACKRFDWDAPPTRGAALQQLRIKARQMGANAVANVTYDEQGTDYGTNCWSSMTASADAVVR